jgi:hypothetical protein
MLNRSPPLPASLHSMKSKIIVMLLFVLFLGDLMQTLFSEESGSAGVNNIPDGEDLD